MYRLYDFLCTECGTEREALIEVPNGQPIPDSAVLSCEGCLEDLQAEYPAQQVIEKNTMHERLVSPPAQYLGERVLNPIMHGGTYDTTGSRALPELPDLPGAAESSAQLSRKLAALPLESMSDKERKEAVREASESVDAPTTADYRALFATSEYKDAAKRRETVRRENAAKRARFRALKRGENVNFRRDKVQGDPKITA